MFLPSYGAAKEILHLSVAFAPDLFVHDTVENEDKESLEGIE